jgi:hypothetical protein
MWKSLCLVLTLALASCAGVAPLPGGGDSVNAKYYQSPDDFKARVAQLQAGMNEQLVLDILGRQANEMTRLSRQEVVVTLLGPNTMQVLDDSREREETRRFLQSLYGYKLEYKDVDKHLGFASPIRMRTEETGFGYEVSLIFQNGVLVEKPEMTGGIVNESSSKTLFEYLNPGTMISGL